MKYETIDGITIDLSDTNLNDPKLIDWLKEEYKSSKSWTEFVSRTGHGVENETKRLFGKQWQSHPLYIMRLDLVANKSIEKGEARGTMSRMFYD
jgi:hypothetical protein